MKRYRTSGIRIFILLIVATIIAAALAFSKANTLHVLFGIEAIFLLLAFAAWAYVEIHFDGSDIVRTSFFVISSRHQISAIKRVRFGSDQDSFGGRTTYATIEFTDAKPFLLFDFAKADLREITDRISAAAPNAIDTTISKHLNKEADSSGPKTLLRPGGRLLFVSCASVAL